MKTVKANCYKHKKNRKVVNLERFMTIPMATPTRCISQLTLLSPKFSIFVSVGPGIPKNEKQYRQKVAQFH